MWFGGASHQKRRRAITFCCVFVVVVVCLLCLWIFNLRSMDIECFRKNEKPTGIEGQQTLLYTFLYMHFVYYVAMRWIRKIHYFQSSFVQTFRRFPVFYPLPLSVFVSLSCWLRKTVQRIWGKRRKQKNNNLQISIACWILESNSQRQWTN